MAGDGGNSPEIGRRGFLKKVGAFLGLAGLVGGTAAITHDPTDPSGMVNPETGPNTSGPNKAPVIAPYNNEGVGPAPTPEGAVTPDSPLTPIQKEPTPIGAVKPDAPLPTTQPTGKSS